MNVTEYNRQAWDGYVERGSEWTIGVSHEEIERARNGEWQIILTPLKPVPRSWFPTELHEKKSARSSFWWRPTRAYPCSGRRFRYHFR